MDFVGQSNEDIELVDVMQSGGFKNWDKYQNKYMRAPESIQNYHVFQVNAINPNRLMCQEAHGYPIIYDDNVVKKQFRDLPDWGSLDELEDLPPLGVKDIKWITLYDEWRPLIPVDFRKDYFYFHNDPGPERREKNKINRNEAAETRKSRSTTLELATKPSKKRRPSPAKKVEQVVAKKKQKEATAKAKAKAKPAAAKKKPPIQKKQAPKKQPASKRGPFQFGKL
jgi:hypothetical protein